MAQNRHIQYDCKYGWDLIDRKEWLNFASKQSNQLKFLSYGCDLDYKSIHQLIKDFSLSGVKKQDKKSIVINFESYDANQKIHNNLAYYFDTVRIDGFRFVEFENELHNLFGNHIRCVYNIRGHFEVQLYGKKFSTLVYKTLDCSAVYREALEGRYIFFIDSESEDNHEIRHKIHLLPVNLQSLTLPVNFTEIQKEVYIKDWIRRIIAY